MHDALQVMEEIVQRTADAMVSEGAPFRGVLFAGLMIKNGRAKLLEHNVRFGDPECQGLMMRLQSDLLEVLLAACDGHLSDVALQWSPEVRVVAASTSYKFSMLSLTSQSLVSVVYLACCDNNA